MVKTTSILYLDCTTVIEASATNIEINKHEDRSRNAYYVYKYMVCVEFNHACHAHSYDCFLGQNVGKITFFVKALFNTWAIR